MRITTTSVSPTDFGINISILSVYLTWFLIIKMTDYEFDFEEDEVDVDVGVNMQESNDGSASN